jgi:hypothetical protein
MRSNQLSYPPGSGLIIPNFLSFLQTTPEYLANTFAKSGGFMINFKQSNYHTTIPAAKRI